jgi:hypothetical protein
LDLTRPAGKAHVVGPDQELIFVPLHLERIGDNLELLIRAITTMVEEGSPSPSGR